MNFVVLPAEGTMSIDNSEIQVSTVHLLPRPDIEILAWNGAAGKGFIEYNHGARVVDRFEDLVPYRFFVDAWLNAAPGLSVAQAQQIKIDMVETLYNNKRRAPYMHYDGQVYEASDEAVMYMGAVVAAHGLYDRVDELISRVDASLGQIIGELNAGVTSYNQSAAAIDGWSPTHAQNWQYLDLSFDNYGGAPGIANTEVGGAPGQPTTMHIHSVHLGRATRDFFSYQPSVGPAPGSEFGYMSGISPQDISTGGQSGVLWQPLSAGGPYLINSIVFRDALRGILARRNILDNARRIRTTAIRGLGSIAAVISYDVASGW